MVSGRTKPCLFFCENENGEPQGEYIVKLKAGMESRENGLVAELVASQLASYLDIPSPEAAIINIDTMWAEAVSDAALSQKIKGSIGLNFGSKNITGGFDTWPIGKAVPSGLMQAAAEIFAFDAMIQNPDRRADKPNVLWKGDQLYIIDHEMGFSFIYDVLSQAKPWEITKLKFMSNHLFFGNLKGRSIQIERFAGAVETITESIVKGIMSAVPVEWHSHSVGKMTDHIMEIVNHVNDFIDEVRRTLS